MNDRLKNRRLPLLKARLWRSLCLMLAVLAGTWILLPEAARAAESASQTVRVGWYESSCFHTGASDAEEKSGYSYAYLQKVANYTGWTYEYVYGDWSELYDMLEAGDIDLLAGMSATDARRETMLFPNSEMGTEEYHLFKRSGDALISSSDRASLNGKRVGLIENNLMSDATESWIARQNLRITPVYFSGFAERDAALKAGEIDLITTTLDGALASDSIQEVAKVGDEAYYLAVSAARKDLLAQLDDALDILFSLDPYFLQGLRYQYYGSNFVTRDLTDAERGWLADHSTLTVGYLDDYLPYSDQDENGEAQGLVTDALTIALAALNLDETPQIRYVAYSGYDAMKQALLAGEADLIFPVGNNLWQLEQDGLHATARVVSDSGTLFYKNVSEKSEVKSLAVIEGNSPQIVYSRHVYPDAQLLPYSSMDECLQAVLDGEVDATMIESLRVQSVTTQDAYAALSYHQLSDTLGKSFGVSRENRELLLIFNSAISTLGESYATDYAYRYISGFFTYGLLDAVKAHLPLVFGGIALLGFAVTALLVHSLRKKERQLREKDALTQKAEAAARAKAAFLFNMSHDIRTPMNAVLGFAGLMEHELDRPEQLKEHLSKLQSAGQYLLELLNNVLEIARIDNGKETLEETLLDLSEDKILPLFENEIRKKQLTVTRSCDLTHRYVWGDGAKLEEIQVNLVSNAVKYTPEGGRIELRLREEPCSRAGFGTFVCEVADTGIGMTPEFQKEIFDSFSRERNTTKSRVAGTGLGMAIVKRLTDLMGGQIAVVSAPGQGSTFTLTVTLRLEEEEATRLLSRPAQELTDLAGLRILLAEDNDLNAEIATALLERAGARADRAEDGAVCVSKLSGAPAGTYDLILMDIQMPNLDGLQAAQQIRALPDPRKAGIPIVAMTANTFDEDRQAAFAAGMNGYIGKPLRTDEMARVLHTVLSKKA